MKTGRRNQSIRPNRINQEIFANKVRLTGTDGKQIGIVSLDVALLKSQELELDLVEINSNTIPPVCRIMDYGKFLYEKNKSIKEQKKKQKIIHLKEIKFRPNTDEGDYKIKLRNIIRFLQLGDKIKITLRFRGGELAHQDLGVKILHRLCNDLQEWSVVDFFPNKLEGRQMVMLLSSKK
ncbi:translation initiation factor IF-3 [Blochmannia endosymbiont of Polyrhachis (Hedomyrma) turneri]|uniref:translation initiation factor IF-3 n=1 Tax=Blochmannia endosymbiont of Polyrhachis (Hedomyrma) turneri TaxID=1505596 RepID=UPI00061A5B37|nr:translation initiation factor IF-3 [Blochmannia endosymbiont of Polyrhachis (Hedomyrma) turneri]AKC59922.1 Translation initiation factor IF-3 [Blochmannia endosymbiont of Polyrhachis (Hedomyrma) turneri]